MPGVIEYKGDIFEKITVNPNKPDTYIGRVVHRLTVLDIYMRITEGRKRVKYCLCRCECGVTKLIDARGLRGNRVKSCGCWKSAVTSKRCTELGKANKQHGMARTRVYKIWSRMKRRCVNPKDKDYVVYGGRGITYDPRWESFDHFYEDMKEGYTDGLTLERVDVNGDYTKTNCTWITNQEQQWNKTNNAKVSYNGNTYNMRDLQELTGIPHRALYQRYRKGWTPEQIVNTPYKGKR